MRCIWILVSGLLASASACAAGHSETAQVRDLATTGPSSNRPDAKRPKAQASSVEANHNIESWIRELVDPSVFEAPLRLHVGGDRIAVLAQGDGNGFGALSLEGGKWNAQEVTVGGIVLSATWQAPNIPWTLFEAEGGVAVRHGFDGSDEQVVAGLPSLPANLLPHDIAVDPGGIPHVCLSVEGADGAKDFVYATRTGSRRSPWRVERLPLAIAECRIIATEDAVHILTLGPHGINVFSRMKGGSWRIDQWSASQGPIAAARGPSGAVALAYSDDSKLAVKKFVAGRWASVALPTTGAGSIRAVALAVSSGDQIHVALASEQGLVTSVFYAMEGDASAEVITTDSAGEIGLQLDGSDAPHIVYTTTHVHQLVHARRRLANDPHLQRGTISISLENVLDACATVISAATGEQRSAFARGYADRWCNKDFVRSLLDVNALGARCDGGDANACVVGGIIATKTATLVSLDLAPCLEGDLCRNSVSGESLLLDGVEHGGDEALATKMLTHGCELGVGAACLQVANTQRHQGGDSTESFAKACHAGLAVGCAALLDTDAAKIQAPVALQARAALTGLCKRTTRPDACNALGYMEERGIGGKKQRRAALDHYQRSCQLGSVLSCARLLVGPFGKQRAPAGIDAATFEEMLSGRCDLLDETACLALARAFDMGWVVARDRERARSVLVEACEEGIAAACKRIGRITPPRKP